MDISIKAFDIDSEINRQKKIKSLKGFIVKEKRVFIVDDSSDFRRHLKRFLLAENGIQIIGEASNGEQAIFETIRTQPDVILMDINMPGLNGIETTNQIIQMLPQMKIIMLSVNDDDEYKIAAKENGAAEYVVKKDILTQLVPSNMSVCLSRETKDMAVHATKSSIEN